MAVDISIIPTRNCCVAESLLPGPQCSRPRWTRITKAAKFNHCRSSLIPLRSAAVTTCDWRFDCLNWAGTNMLGRFGKFGLMVAIMGLAAFCPLVNGQEPDSPDDP